MSKFSSSIFDTTTVRASDVPEIKHVKIEFLKGEQGDIGPQGEKGATGDVGKPGPQGERGMPGPQGKSGIQGMQGKQGEKGESGINATPTHTTEIVREELTVSDQLVKDILKAMYALPEKDRLDVSKGLRNAQSFIFNKKRYKIEELMHGGGSSSGSSANVVTQYSLTATQVGSSAVVALSQLTHFATFTNVIAAMRNQIPQTNGVTCTVTATQVTFIGADAGEVFSITYAYS